MTTTGADQVELGLLRLRSAMSYDALPADTRADVKSRIVDTAAALLCGLNEPPCPRLRRFAQDVYPAGTASIVGTPIRTQLETAAFVNATTARVAELNDTYHVPGKPGIHASDVVFPLVALAEARRSSGRDLIAGIALAYESCLRMFEASPPVPGFDATNFVALGVAVGAAALLGLDDQQARNCISILVVSHNTLRRARLGEASSWKAAASGQAGRSGLFAALLAAGRIDGPVAPFDGPGGWREAVARGELELDALTLVPPGQFRLSRSIIKPRAACGTTIPSILAAEAAHRQLPAPGAIEAVLVETFRDAVAKNASGAHHWSPATREVADHSIPYVVAAALREGTVTPSQFDPAHLADPDLRRLTRLVEVVEEPSFTRHYETAQRHRARVTVQLCSGTALTGESGGEFGDIADVMDARSVDAKFMSLTAGLLGERRARSALERLRALDSEEVASDVLSGLELGADDGAELPPRPACRSPVKRSTQILEGQLHRRSNEDQRLLSNDIQEQRQFAVEMQVYVMSVDSGPNDVLRRLDDAPPLRERILEQLELLIISGSLAPGARLVEGELADTLGVSRGPIREALQLLWADGFVDLRPRQGAFVHVPTRKEIDDFFDIRRALERESVRLATVRITAVGAQRLRDVLDRARELLDKGDDPSSVHQEVRIHREITHIADNDVLTKMLGDLEKRSSWYRAPFSPVVRRRAWDEHEVIVTAIIEGDVDAAMSAISLHTDQVRENLYAAIGSDHGLAGPADAEHEPARRRPDAGGLPRR